jgi:hypothetical protein
MIATPCTPERSRSELSLSPISAVRPGQGGQRRWQALVTGLALTVGLGAQSFAAEPGLQGRWIMSAPQSSFEEGVTGPRPDAATVIVTRDDPQRLAYQLVESRAGTEVARGDYDISFRGGASTSSVDGSSLAVDAVRQAAEDVVIRAPRIGREQASIRMRQTGPDTAELEHDVAGPSGVRRLEVISLVRADETASR